MLAPAVRPDGVVGAASAPSTPIESVSFDALLEEARAVNATEAASAGASERDAAPSGRAGLLGRLAPVDRVANASVLTLLAGAGPEAGSE